MALRALTAFLLPLAFACAAAAPPIPSERMERFRALDTDGDRALSRAEAARHADVRRDFDFADANGDGRLDLREFNVLDAKLARDRRPGMAGETYSAPSEAR